MDVDFFYHMVLATWLCLILNIWFNKRWASIFTITVGIVYEGFDLWLNQDAYRGIKHHLKDSLLDIGAAVLAVGVLMIILKVRDKPFNS